jgi:hypothetical protein
MSTEVTDSGNSDPGPAGAATNSDWRFQAVLVAALLACGYVSLRYGLFINAAIAANLPLLLPLAVTVLSIFTRASDIRNYESVLKISNDLAIGIISFDIWAISASRSDAAGRVLVNATKMIRGDFVIPFLLSGLLISVGCVVLTHYGFKGERTKRRSLLVGLLASVLIYIAPFGALEQVPPPAPPPDSKTASIRKYTVVIPYQDPGIVGFAPTFLRDRLLVRFERNIDASSLSDAEALAIQRFSASSESNQVKNRAGEKVIIRKDQVLVVER